MTERLVLDLTPSPLDLKMLDEGDSVVRITFPTSIAGTTWLATAEARGGDPIELAAEVQAGDLVLLVTITEAQKAALGAKWGWLLTQLEPNERPVMGGDATVIGARTS